MGVVTDRARDLSTNFRIVALAGRAASPLRHGIDSPRRFFEEWLQLGYSSILRPPRRIDKDAAAA
jgi:hypothetical protein